MLCGIFGCKFVKILSEWGTWCGCCIAIKYEQKVCVRCWFVSHVSHWTECRRVFKPKVGKTTNDGVYR